MIKRKEVSNPDSCMNRAHDDEMIFVLLARDIAAPVAIMAWVQERLRIGKNNPSDEQIVDAMQCAIEMTKQRKAGRTRFAVPDVKRKTLIEEFVACADILVGDDAPSLTDLDKYERVKADLLASLPSASVVAEQEQQ